MPLHESERRLVATVTALCIAAALAVLLTLSASRVDAAVLAEAGSTSPNYAPAPVLVELFTSEGCSSCPPADALLDTLDRTQPVAGAEIIILGEHVDYWDSLGWKDRFSSAEFTRRQREYGTSFRLGDIYTPQMVINGARQLNGTDSSGARRAIQEQAATDPPAALRFRTVNISGDKVSFTLAGASSRDETVDLYAALVEPAATTDVRAGENGGRTLHHAGVARSLSRIGRSWRMGELETHSFAFSPNLANMTANTNSHGESFGGLRLVVFAQGKNSGHVRGIAWCVIGPVSPGAGSQTSVPANRCPFPGI
jgi:hypothetical protein